MNLQNLLIRLQNVSGLLSDNNYDHEKINESLYYAGATPIKCNSDNTEFTKPCQSGFLYELEDVVSRIEYEVGRQHEAIYAYKELVVNDFDIVEAN